MGLGTPIEELRESAKRIRETLSPEQQLTFDKHTKWLAAEEGLKELDKSMDQAIHGEVTDLDFEERNAFVVAIDFDGTLVGHAYPQIGPDAGAVPYLLELAKIDPCVKFVLWTCRSEGYELAALKWCNANGLPIWHVAHNPTQKEFSNSRKLHAALFIDDRNPMVPLTRTDGATHINWEVYGPALIEWFKFTQ